MEHRPSEAQLVGAHLAAYESLYKQIDPAGVNQIGALDAAAFLKRSALPDTVLRDIWELADPDQKGYLDRYGFFVALKMIALAQSGVSPSEAALIQTETPAPRLQNTPPAIDWNIKAENRKKYEEMFQSLGPQNGLLPGNKVKPVMLNSKLPFDVLGRIWDLSDQDQDGSLDMEEFIVAMHLVSKALIENAPIPMSLPPQLIKKPKSQSEAIIPDLIPSGFTDAPSPAPVSAPTPPAVTSPPTAAGQLTGTESPAENVGNGDSVMEIEREKHMKLFKRLDTDRDGYVNGADCKQTFLDTGLPQQDLAYIWGSVDIAQTGRLNTTQFVQAMGMVEEKLRERSKPTGNKELDALNEEIRQLQTEKRIIQEEVDVVEAEAKAREAEVAAARRELEQLQAMLRQLEVQKREANKKLAELGVQKGALEQRLTETTAQLEDEQEKVAALRKTFEEEKQAIEEAMNQEDPKEKELADELKKMQEEIENRRAILKELDERKEAAMAKLAEEVGFAEDPFAGSDPFASSGGDPFGGDPFGSSAAVSGGVDPFGGDPFASRASPTPALPPKAKGGAKAAPPRPAPPSRPPGPTRAAPAPPVPPPPSSGGGNDDPFAPSNPGSAPSAQSDGFANFDAFGASAF